MSLESSYLLELELVLSVELQLWWPEELLLAWAIFPGEEQAEEATAVLGSSGSSSQAATPPSVIAWKGEEDNESLSSSQNPGRNKQTDQEGGREEGRRS